MPNVYLCVYGHFYQPPRANPFTGSIDRELAAAPYHDFNEKIWDECYRANAVAGNFSRISFDIGPTLATWLASAHPPTLQTIAEAARATHARSGYGNALAQSYHHTILPLATPREKQLQIAWGVRDFRRRFGYAPDGMWLPETAADEATLEEMAAQGMSYTILAPWQATTPDVDTTEPYRIELPDDRALTAFFYNSSLSGDVSFNDDTTADAARFCTSDLAACISQAKLADGAPQMILIATDGELYGHHKRFRDLFLARLLAVEAPANGYIATSPSGFLALAPPSRTASIHPGTSWSCAHGVARWDLGCACTAGDSSWKRPLRQALRSLATRLDDIFEVETRGALRDAWPALEEYIDLREHAVTPAAFWSAHARRTLDSRDEQRLCGLMEMQLARHAMFASCAWFFDDLDRLEPRIALNHARYAITLAGQHAGATLEPGFLLDLGLSLSVRTGRTAADIYGEVGSRQ